MFGKNKKRIIIVNNKQIELEPPRKGIFSFLGKKQSSLNKQKIVNTLNQQPASSLYSSIPSNAKQDFSSPTKPIINVQQTPSQIQKNPQSSPSSADSTSSSSSSLNTSQQQSNNIENIINQNQTKDLETSNKEIIEKINNIKQLSKAPTKIFAKNPLKTPIKMQKTSSFKKQADSILNKHKGLREALLEENIQNPYDFILRIRTAAVLLAILIAAAIFILFNYMHMQIAIILLFSIMIGILTFFMSFNMFLGYPKYKVNQSAKNVEKNILFAARDILISLRSGMPLFNAISSVSTGYGETSKEFSKIIYQVELGTSLQDAIDKTISTSKSASFKKLMIQATTTIKAGADIVSSLQTIIDQLSQERIIELRRYGQRLNALAMFYMLFGVILPSMGIAVATILTTFLPLFTVNVTILELVIIAVVMIQIVFLQLIRQRPIFSM